MQHVSTNAGHLQVVTIVKVSYTITLISVNI